MHVAGGQQPVKPQGIAFRNDRLQQHFPQTFNLQQHIINQYAQRMFPFFGQMQQAQRLNMPGAY
jgi:hypothetical protein